MGIWTSDSTLGQVSGNGRDDYKRRPAYTESELYAAAAGVKTREAKKEAKRAEDRKKNADRKNRAKIRGIESNPKLSDKEKQRKIRKLGGDYKPKKKGWFG